MLPLSLSLSRLPWPDEGGKFMPNTAKLYRRFLERKSRTTHIIVFKLGVQSWSRFVTWKSWHIWRLWAEMTQTPMPKSTKVAQIHLPERNSAKICQILLNLTKSPPKFAKSCQISSKIRQISRNSFHKRANFEHPRTFANAPQQVCGADRRACTPRGSCINTLFRTDLRIFLIES